MGTSILPPMQVRCVAWVGLSVVVMFPLFLYDTKCSFLHSNLHRNINIDIVIIIDMFHPILCSTNAGKFLQNALSVLGVLALAIPVGVIGKCVSVVWVYGCMREGGATIVKCPYLLLFHLFTIHTTHPLCMYVSIRSFVVRRERA